jgi:hypothetical protein
VAAVIGVGLDGQPVEVANERPAGGINPQRGDANMAQFDMLPRWAQRALNGDRLSFKVKTGEVAPYIAMGMLTPENIEAQLMANDHRLREGADREHS